MNLSNKLWDPLKDKLLDQVFVMEVSLRLVEYDEEYSEQLEFVNCTKSVDLRRMRTTRNSQKRCREMEGVGRCRSDKLSRDE
ncbi:hypothetical protein A2U01_0080093 [Trifolium medium]|uniref:Uncharacterized protein n=1 Tax=Trifolium medium TaxID=97028 RepID=A0A392TCU3_9FABA|nr:hypothetical protein [Trifolium medium]